jgi:hypothetical protein
MLILPSAISNINSAYNPKINPVKPISDILQIINYTKVKGKLYVIPVTDEIKKWSREEIALYRLIKNESHIVLLQDDSSPCEILIREKRSFILSYTNDPFDCSDYFDQKNETVEDGYLISRK